MTADGRQRWRCYLRMPASDTPDGQPGGARGWANLFAAAGLPLAGEEGGRGRVSPAAQLPLGIAGDREIVDVILAERLPAARVRALIVDALPAHITLVDLHDVWLGAPSAPAAVVAADYAVAASGPPATAMLEAAAALLAASALPRERHRERKVQTYDLRMLIRALEIAEWDDAAPDGPAGLLRMRLRHGSEAVGRPEEVIAALAELIAGAHEPAAVAPPAGSETADAPGSAMTVTIRSIRRLRLVMADD